MDDNLWHVSARAQRGRQAAIHKMRGVRFKSYPLCSLREGRVLRVGWERGHYLRGVLDLSLVRYRHMPAVQMNGIDELGSSNLVLTGPIGGVTEGQGY